MRSISHANMRVQFTSLSYRSHRERQGVLALNDIGIADLNCTPFASQLFLRHRRGYSVKDFMVRSMCLYELMISQA